MNKNRETLCGFYEDNQDSNNEDGAGSCSATVELNAGKKGFGNACKYVKFVAVAPQEGPVFQRKLTKNVHQPQNMKEQ